MVAVAGLENDIRSTDEAAAKLARPSGEMIFVTAEARYHTCRYCIFAQDSAKEKEDEKKMVKKMEKMEKEKQIQELFVLGPCLLRIVSVK
jgi:hypothetical protein